jgi:hypothetical protein
MRKWCGQEHAYSFSMFFENLSGRKAPAKFYFKDDDLQT